MATNLAGVGDLTTGGPIGIPVRMGDAPEVPCHGSVRGLVIVPLEDSVDKNKTNETPLPTKTEEHKQGGNTLRIPVNHQE